MAKWPHALVALLLAALILTACGGMTSAWGAVGPANGEVIISLAADPHNAQLLYAGGSDGHIYRVSTGDSTTLSAGQGLPARDAVNAVLPDPATAGRVLAATTDGLYLSTDAGRHWTAYGSGLPAKDSVETITFGDQPNSLYAGTEAHGAYASQDNGKTWQSDAAGLPEGADIYTLFWSAHTQTLFAGLVGSGVYALPNGQQTWQSSAQGIPGRTDVFAFAELDGQHGQPDTLCAGTSAGLYRSTDGGHAWQAPLASSGLPAGRVLSLATQAGAPTALYAGTDSSVYQSADSGRHWAEYAPGLSAHVAAIVVLPQRTGAPVLFAAAGPLQRVPSPAPGPSLSTLLIGAILLAMLLFWLWRRQAIYQDLTRRQEESRRRDQDTPTGGTE